MIFDEMTGDPGQAPAHAHEAMPMHQVWEAMRTLQAENGKLREIIARELNV